MGTPLGPKYIPYTYMDPLGSFGEQGTESYRSPASAIHRCPHVSHSLNSLKGGFIVIRV